MCEAVCVCVCEAVCVRARVSHQKCLMEEETDYRPSSDYCLTLL